MNNNRVPNVLASYQDRHLVLLEFFTFSFTDYKYHAHPKVYHLPKSTQLKIRFGEFSYKAINLSSNIVKQIFVGEAYACMFC